MAAVAENALLQFVDAHRDDLLDLVNRLVATPSPNLPGDERAVVALLQAEWQKFGLPTPVILAAKPDRPNLVCTLEGQTGGKRLMYSGHTDTKPVGEAASQWLTDPFQPTLKDGNLYGLGTSDMKGPDAAIMYATFALAATGVPLRGRLQLVYTSDEENGSTHGANYLAQNRLVEADVALIVEPAGLTRDFEYLHLISRGVTCFRIKVYGTQMHSSISDRFPSINASAKLGWVLWRASRELKFRHQPHPLCPTGPTVNPGVTMKGGVQFGVFPGYAEFASDVRLIPGMSFAEIQEDINGFLDHLRAEDPELKVELEFVPGRTFVAATEVSPDEPLVKILQSTAGQVLGSAPPLSCFPGGTDARAFQGIAGIPTIPSFGPGLLPPCHGPNEFINIEAIVEATKIYALAAYRYLSN